MNRHIDDILKDLYAIDPVFKQHEGELRALISKVLALRPDTHFDEGFAARLRAELVASRPERFEAGKIIVSPFTYIKSFHLYSGLAGALAAFLIIAPATYFTTEHTLTKNEPVTNSEVSIKDITAAIPAKQQISDKGKNAFGLIAVPKPVAVTTPKTTEGTTLAAPAARTAVPTYTYAYAGDQFSLGDASGSVLKRNRSVALNKDLVTALEKANLGIINLSDFDFNALSMHTLDLSESKPDGYSLSINFDDGMVAIASNAKQSATSSEKLDGATLTSIAADFLASHGIDRTSYGQATISDMADNTVIFPLMINGKEVYDEQGHPYGLEVKVNPESRKVASVTNLAFQQYDSSTYPLESDPAAVIKAVSASSSERSLNLGTPDNIYMRYTTSDAAGTVTELYVPALLFPIKASTSTPSTAPRAVVFPLAKLGSNPANQ